MELIQSTKNEKVKVWKKLLTKKGRDETGHYLIEGFHLIEEALKMNEIVELIIQDQVEIPLNWEMKKTIPITYISVEVAKVISATITSQGIFAVCKKKHSNKEITNCHRFLLLDRVQDPGNLGTIIRTADAAGIDVIVLGKGTGDIYNPKVIRSAQGSHFRMDIRRGNIEEWIAHLKTKGIPVYGTALDHAIPYKHVKPSDTFALILGNEGAGVDPTFLNQTDSNLYIPIHGQSESLNVAIAAAILMYHLRE